MGWILSRVLSLLDRAFQYCEKLSFCAFFSFLFLQHNSPARIHPIRVNTSNPPLTPTRAKVNCGSLTKQSGIEMAEKVHNYCNELQAS